MALNEGSESQTRRARRDSRDLEDGGGFLSLALMVSGWDVCCSAQAARPVTAAVAGFGWSGGDTARG